MPAKQQVIPARVLSPSARATSAREVAPNKRITRMDPQEMQRQHAQELHDEDPTKHPAPQQGISSSELNTSTPAVKKQARDDAKA